MHHKFAIIDDKLWVGTFNFSIGASLRNWECMFRIKEKETIQQFVDEFYIMYRMGLISNELPNGTKIVQSKKVLKTIELIRDTKCTLCNQIVDNSHDHYIFEEHHFLQYKLTYDHYEGQSRSVTDIDETFFIAKCRGQQGVIPYPDTNCNDCGKYCKGSELTKCFFEMDYVNDGSVAFHEAYDSSIHQPEKLLLRRTLILRSKFSFQRMDCAQLCSSSSNLLLLDTAGGSIGGVAGGRDKSNSLSAGSINF